MSDYREDCSHETSLVGEPAARRRHRACRLRERHIRSALAQWVEAANRGDYPSALAVWAPDLIGWAPDGSDDTYARERKFAQLPQQPPKTTYALQIEEVIVDGSLAVVRDAWTQ